MHWKRNGKTGLELEKQSDMTIKIEETLGKPKKKDVKTQEKPWKIFRDTRGEK